MTDFIILIVAIIIAAQTSYLVYSTLNRQSRRTRRDLIFVDTSVLIDGRILEVATTGFVPGTLSIPRSVIAELQFLADQADHDKRTRARHGLDVASQLQAIPDVNVEIYNDRPTTSGVDNRLLELAKRHSGVICTIDFNLIKVAKVEKLRVLNINDLAKTLRMAFLPGEQTKIELTQKGNDQHQGVGHLSDGTMVVVEQAASLVGQTVMVEFIRSLQTAAGRMMFAKLVDVKPKQAPRNVNPAKQTRKPVRPPQQKAATTSTPPKPKQQPKRRRSNEDRLVELANK